MKELPDAKVGHWCLFFYCQAKSPTPTRVAMQYYLKKDDACYCGAIGDKGKPKTWVDPSPGIAFSHHIYHTSGGRTVTSHLKTAIQIMANWF